MKATYAKLSSGAWGIRVEPPIISLVGAVTVTVTKKDGSQKTETVEREVFREPSGRFALYAIVETRRPQATSRRGYSRGDASCDECDFNQDAGDMQGCPRHRGNPRC